VCGGSASPLNAQLVGAQQLIMPAGDALDADEIAGTKVFDSRGVERDQARPLRKFLVSSNFEAPTSTLNTAH